MEWSLYYRVGKVLGTKVLGVRFRRIIPPRLNYVAGLQGEKPPLTIKHTLSIQSYRPPAGLLTRPQADYQTKTALFLCMGELCCILAFFMLLETEIVAII